MGTAEQAEHIMRSWHGALRLTREAYAEMGAIAARCGIELGGDLPNSALSHSQISSWLRRQENVWVNGRDYIVPDQRIYLGEPE